ncbi:TetR-like C-terminal domain-containing protein [Paenibacillus pseudetheri]|uniref:TetR-like C-terminal domain-containing protein n=1 Tax=Paenibacillus pseudetheri TaxID=2897682 RepID=UPI001F43C690|nr:TetR-like C-terminal domain-containing protein [Paenibacillus pseudetheri]
MEDETEPIMIQFLENNLDLDKLSKDISVQFLSSATVGVIEWWFTHSNPCSAKEITEKLWSMLDLNLQMIHSQA